MPYDPNDPNQGSQAPGPEGDPYAGGQSLDSLVRSRPAVAAWLAQHRGGHNLSQAEQFALMHLIQSQGIDTQRLGVNSEGQFVDPKANWWNEYGKWVLLAFGPVAAAAAVGAAGGGAAASGGSLASAGGTGAAVDVGAGAAVPAAAAGGVEAGAVSGLGSAALPGAGTALGGAGAAGAGAAEAGAFDAAGNFIGDTTVTGAASGGGSTFASRLASPGVAGAAGNVISALIQAQANGSATAAQQAYLQQALDYAKAKDAYDRQLNATQYADLRKRLQPYVQSGVSANDRIAATWGLPARDTSAPASSPPPVFDPNPPGSVPAPGRLATPSNTVGTAQPAGQSAGQPLPRAGDGSVLMQEPGGGSQQRVPQSEVAHWISKGATIVQGAV
jgi:hypothetical protein